MLCGLIDMHGVRENDQQRRRRSIHGDHYAFNDEGG